MNLIKKHGAIPAIVAALAIIVVLTVNTYSKKADITFSIEDIVGSRASIATLAVSGELRDGYHRTGFRIEGGEVSTSTELFEQPQWAIPRRFNPGAPKSIEGLEYEVHGTYSLEVVSRDWVNSVQFPIGMARIPSAAAYPISGSRDGSAAFANVLEYGLAGYGGKVYFTMPVTRDYSGRTGIYELNFYPWGIGPGADSYAARRVAEINLDAGAGESRGAGIDVLGLESVGDRLAVVMVEGNRLRIRGYDSVSGQLLGEASVPDFYLAGQPAESANNAAVTHSANYEAFSDPVRSMLSLGFRQSGSRPGQLRETVISVDFTDGVRIANEVGITFDDGDEDSFSGVSYASYQDGRLYVVKTFREHAADSPMASRMYDPKRFWIYVYERSELIYKGELKTDLNDDNFRAIPLAAMNSGLPYNQMEYRYFDNVKIE